MCKDPKLTVCGSSSGTHKVTWDHLVFELPKLFVFLYRPQDWVLIRRLIRCKKIIQGVLLLMSNPPEGRSRAWSCLNNVMIIDSMKCRLGWEIPANYVLEVIIWHLNLLNKKILQQHERGWSMIISNSCGIMDQFCACLRPYQCSWMGGPCFRKIASNQL